MISSPHQLADLMVERGITAIALRAPSEHTRGKWRVAYRTSEFQLNWHEASSSVSLMDALEKCFNVQVAPRPKTRLADLLG